MAAASCHRRHQRRSPLCRHLTCAVACARRAMSPAHSVMGGALRNKLTTVLTSTHTLAACSSSSINNRAKVRPSQDATYLLCKQTFR